MKYMSLWSLFNENSFEVYFVFSLAYIFKTELTFNNSLEILN
jgi:hypothetical protein